MSYRVLRAILKGIQNRDRQAAAGSGASTAVRASLRRSVTRSDNSFSDTQLAATAPSNH